MGSGYQPCDGPVPVPSLAGDRARHSRRFLGGDFAVAVTESGDLYCAGNSYAAPPPRPAILTRPSEAAMRTVSRRLRDSTLPELNGNVLDIRVGVRSHACPDQGPQALRVWPLAVGTAWRQPFHTGRRGRRFHPRAGVDQRGVVRSRPAHSVAVKDDGTVWTWGHNDQHSDALRRHHHDRRVPTPLDRAGGSGRPGRGVQGEHADERPRTGAIYACGSDAYRAAGLGDREALDPWTPVPRPTRVPVPAVKSSRRCAGRT